uniref:Histone-lysine N-methyltransferase 2D n=1 Tax=Drosophila rhopaloa TaxID=1041015 RepID=A0A6P4ERU6_DRORH
MLRGLLVVVLVAWSQVDAATHVNISIAQQPATNPADVKYLEGSAPAELRAGPHMDEDRQFQRIQERQQQVQPQSQSQQQQQQQVVQTQQQQQPQQLSPRQGLGLQPPAQGQPPMSKNGRLPRRRNHSRRPSIHQQPPSPHSGQFRQRNQQLRQNQEFERYIQSYHSHGPTVETVYESSNPAPQRYTQTSSGVTSSMDDAAPQKMVTIGGGHRSQQLRMFERQVAAPVSSQGQSANVEAAQDSKPIYEPAQAPIQTANIAPAVSSSSSSSGGASSSSSSSSSAAAPAAPSLPSDASSGYDSSSGFSPSTSYNRPSYDPSGFSYEDAQEVEYQDQYPPEVDDAPGYEDYGEQSGYQGGSGYLPPAPPRGYTPPQRPLVTKTIQIVQPALKAKKYEVRHPAIQKEFYDIEERVVIKPAGTLVVELEHPVAKIPKGETLLPLGHPHPAVASAYSNNNNGQIQTQNTYNGGAEYRPSYDQPAAAKDQQTTTIGSSVTTMPSYDQAPKDDYVESRLQQQQPLGDVTDGNQKNPSFVTGVDGQGNAIKINTKHLTPSMVQRAEPEQEYQRSGQRVYQQRNNFNRQPYNEDDDYFSGEYLPNVSAGSVEAKPARLELAEEEERPTQIIKHEHKIHLPPSQHNIYLGRSRQVPLKERRVQEVPAQVSEIKPYLKSHSGPTVVYAKTQSPRTYYNQPSRQRVAEELDYSAPYSQMRFSPDDRSSRLVQSPQVRYRAESASARLVEAPPKRQEEVKKEQNTHIQIQIANDQDKSAVVATTIAPDCDKGQQRAEQKSQRLVEAPNSEVSATQATPAQTKSQPDVDVSQNGAAGHLKPNERVIAATAAPTDASATSETFHKRRIVVNHPFQTVREVVEHEPFTNYHQIQVNEPAPPSHYHQAYYQPAPQTHGSLVHFQTSSTHGNLYAPYG